MALKHRLLGLIVVLALGATGCAAQSASGSSDAAWTESGFIEAETIAISPEIGTCDGLAHRRRR